MEEKVDVSTSRIISTAGKNVLFILTCLAGLMFLIADFFGLTVLQLVQTDIIQYILIATQIPLYVFGTLMLTGIWPSSGSGRHTTLKYRVYGAALYLGWLGVGALLYCMASPWRGL